MKIKYANEFIKKSGMRDPKTCVYQLINNENDSYGTNIIQYFIMHGLGLCIKVYSYVTHMFYAWLFSHNAAVPISIKKIFYFISLNTYTNIFTWGAGNYNKNRT